MNPSHPSLLILTSACRRNEAPLGIDGMDAVLPWHSPCNSAPRGMNLAMSSLHYIHSDIYIFIYYYFFSDDIYILKEDGLELTLSQFPFTFTVDIPTETWKGPRGDQIVKLTLFQVVAIIIIFFPIKKCQTRVALTTRSTGRRTEARLPTDVGLLRFLKSSAANQCQQNPQSASFSSKSDAHRNGQCVLLKYWGQIYRDLSQGRNFKPTTSTLGCAFGPLHSSWPLRRSWGQIN